MAKTVTVNLHERFQYHVIQGLLLMPLSCYGGHCTFADFCPVKAQQKPVARGGNPLPFYPGAEDPACREYRRKTAERYALDALGKEVGQALTMKDVAP